MLRQDAKGRRRGFTLVEIMIVVSIIGLLATMGIPSFVRARRTARISNMVNDLRILYDAFGLYSMESGSYPDGWGAAPAPVTEYLSNAKWGVPTSLGGRWLYYKAFGTYLLVVDDFHYDWGQNPLASQDDWLEVDKRIDDGDLATGFFRLIAGVQMQYSLDETSW